MSKILLHYVTEIGPRTIVAEVSDRAAAQAVCNAHLALGEIAALVEEAPRLSVKSLVARKRKQRITAASAVITRLEPGRVRAGI